MTERQSDAVLDLEARVARLEAERDILDLLSRYGHAIDYGLEHEWVDCFSERGVFDMRERFQDASRSTRPEWQLSGIRHEGRAAIAGFVSRHTRAPGRYHKHLVIEPRINVEGDRASLQSYFLFVAEAPEGVEIAFGRYLDRVVRHDDGRWRFDERIAEIEFH
jgi:3-phenylpropionate/cinnamic acid dioxygenase small subunit